jgi:hypothetical protein
MPATRNNSRLHRSGIYYSKNKCTACCSIKNAQSNNQSETLKMYKRKINLSLSGACVLICTVGIPKTKLQNLCYRVNMSVNSINAFNSKPKNISLNRFRRITNLYNCSPLEMEGFFAEYCDNDGYISRRNFYKCLYNDIMDSPLGLNFNEKTIEQFQVIEILYNILDKDNKGVIDYIELCSCLISLCGGSKEEKIYNIWELFTHYNSRDGFTQTSLKLFITSIYKVMYILNPGPYLINIPPERLAEKVVSCTWEIYKLNKHMDYKTFKFWSMRSI